MSVINNILHLPRRVWHKFFGDDDIYIHKIDDHAPWALVCYIPFVFYYRDKKEFMNEHQSQWEAIEIDTALTALGYNVFNISFLTPEKLPDIDFKLITGLEPAFCEACKRYPNARKVYYATGAFVDHQNSMVRGLTDEFNGRYHAEIPYRRMAPENTAARQADAILQIGSKYTIETYPQELQQKICLIHQSSQAINTLAKICYAPENEYFFMSSSGNILKGVPQLIECFSKHRELILHIVGTIEEDVKEAMTSLLTPNIIFHGFMNINSSAYLDIMKKCNFNIYPSSSEGMPGAVLNCMKNGLIPICSRWGSFDEIFGYGYMLEDITADAIEKGLEWSLSLSFDDILDRKQKCMAYVNGTYTLKNFADEYKEYIKGIMKQ